MLVVVHRAGFRLREAQREVLVEAASATSPAGTPPSGATAATTTAVALEIGSLHQSLCDLLLPEIVPLDFLTFASLLQVGTRWRAG
jgi:hypothetical protein